LLRTTQINQKDLSEDMEVSNEQFKESTSNRRVLRSSTSSSSLMSNTSNKSTKQTASKDSNKENGSKRASTRTKYNQQSSTEENNLDEILQPKNDAENKKVNPFKIFEMSGSDKETSNSENHGKDMDIGKRSSLKETKKLPKKEPTTKKNVRIAEEINEKNDCLDNVCCDNKKTYTKSTSTPSGLRRKPLKAPHDISIIGKTE